MWSDADEELLIQASTGTSELNNAEKKGDEGSGAMDRNEQNIVEENKSKEGEGESNIILNVDIHCSNEQSEQNNIDKSDPRNDVSSVDDINKIMETMDSEHGPQEQMELADGTENSDIGIVQETTGETGISIGTGDQFCTKEKEDKEFNTSVINEHLDEEGHFDKLERKCKSTDISAEDSACSHSDKKIKRRKRKPTRKKLRYVSTSSDEDVPLSVYAKQYKIVDDSGSDDLFVPNSKDVNSTDSEYSSNVSDATKRTLNADKILKKRWNKAVKEIKRKQIATTSKKTKHKTTRAYANSDSAIQEAKCLSFEKDVIRTTLIAANEGRLDQILTSEGYKRVQVPPHGNCFFEAACMSELITESPSQLRDALCKHLQDNAVDYMGFLINKHTPEKEEDFVSEYLGEIESLKEDGYWSNKVADFLPLALANYVNCTLTIFTSRPDQQKIIIEPTLGEAVQNRLLYLTYISIPSVLEHYDACIAISNTGTPTMATTVQDETHTPTKQQTPKKAAKFVSPVKKRLFRKRKATPQNWKKNVRKRLRISGEEYIATTGKVMKRKDVKECDCTKCKYRCNDRVSFEQRCAIRDLYYGLTSYERQMDFICSNVHEKTTKSYVDDTGKRVQKRKQVARAYSFVVDSEDIRVCKKFFLNTLSISQATVITALSKKVGGHFQGQDERGKHKAPNKTSDEMLNVVREHIESFPIVDSHYTRKSTKRQFLPPELNIRRMYEAYTHKCTEQGADAVKEPIYRRVFNQEYNLSFHVPKKDQCVLCNRYNNARADGTLDDELKEEYLSHQRRKISAREQKHEDSNKAKQDNSTHTCTFDLQSVLYTPCSLVSLMYYMRKLCCYNLSVYSAGNKKATCYLWSEIDGKRGSCEISTCLDLYISSLEPRIEHVILYSDACTGQNRNQIVATCLLQSVLKSPSIKKIDHKFLESGHTHMECDSMHSAIEFAKSKTKIFVPSQWETVLSMARRKNPYHVVALKYHDFKDFKAVKSSQVKASKTEQGNKLKWTSMKWMRFLKDEPESCFFKYSLNATEAFQKVRLISKRQAPQAQPL